MIALVLSRKQIIAMIWNVMDCESQYKCSYVSQERKLKWLCLLSLSDTLNLVREDGEKYKICQRGLTFVHSWCQHTPQSCHSLVPDQLVSVAGSQIHCGTQLVVDNYCSLKYIDVKIMVKQIKWIRNLF